MCVEIRASAKIEKQVWAWKLFDRYNSSGALRGVYQTSFRFSRGIIIESQSGPGFQAFVLRSDAVEHKDRYDGTCLLKVRLFDARKGIIRGMAPATNGKEGWIAPRILIPKQKKKRQP